MTGAVAAGAGAGAGTAGWLPEDAGADEFCPPLLKPGALAFVLAFAGVMGVAGVGASASWVVSPAGVALAFKFELDFFCDAACG